MYYESTQSSQLKFTEMSDQVLQNQKLGTVRNYPCENQLASSQEAVTRNSGKHQGSLQLFWKHGDLLPTVASWNCQLFYAEKKCILWVNTKSTHPTYLFLESTYINSNRKRSAAANYKQVQTNRSGHCHSSQVDPLLNYKHKYLRQCA